MVSKKKERSSPKLRLIFRPKSEIQTFFRTASRDLLHNFGTQFRLGGAVFNFSPKIGLKSTKNERFCILHKPMGGLEPSRPPGYATALISDPAPRGGIPGSCPPDHCLCPPKQELCPPSEDCVPKKVTGSVPMDPQNTDHHPRIREQKLFFSHILR